MYLIKGQRGRPRYNRPEVDKGTEELQQKRKLLLGEEGLQDFSLAESLLGVFYGRQVISKPLYEAGCYFGELGYRYGACLGHSFRPHTSIVVLVQGKALGGRGSLLSNMEDEKRTKSWRKALKALEGAGAHSYRTVLKVVFYDQDLYERDLFPLFKKEGKPLRDGLNCLADYFKGALKDRRGMLFDPVLNPLVPTIAQQPLKEHRLYTPL